MEQKKRKTKWLPTLYSPDNSGRVRVYICGYSEGYFHYKHGLLWRADGSEGTLTPGQRKVPKNTRADTLLEAAATYADNQWREKQRVERFRTWDKERLPTNKDAKKWLKSDDRKWPAVSKNNSECKEEEVECTPDNPWYGQAKVNGDRRMMWLTDNGEVEMFARSCAREDFADRARADCLEIFKFIKLTWPKLGKVGLDGEMYIPDFQYHQDSRSAISRSVNKHKDDDKLVFVMFDIMEYTKPFSKRAEMLYIIKKNMSHLTNVRFLTTKLLTSRQEVRSFFDKCVNGGFPEGIILRRPYLLYSTKKEHKHKDMIKVKSVHDAEFKVIGYKAAKGTRKGCVVWNLKCKGGDFWCSQPGTVESQRELFQNAEEYIGRYLTVEFDGFTKENKPIFPRALRFRDLSDLPPKKDKSKRSSSSTSSSDSSSEEDNSVSNSSSSDE